MTLRIAVPNKGRLADATLELFQRAGIHLDNTGSRRLLARGLGGRVTVLFVRARDIPEFVEDGTADLGVTGHDLVAETGRDVVEVMDLGFGGCRLSVAVPNESPVQAAKDLPGGARVATSFPRVTREHFDRLGNDVKLVEVSGATEITPHIGVADAIVDLVSSGSTLAMNHLREVDVLLHSTARLIANRTALDDEARTQITSLKAAFQSVQDARGRRYIMANVPRDRLEEVRRVLPGLSGPTIMDILDHADMVAAHAVIAEEQLYDTVNDLKELGASGILVLPIERLVG